MNAPRKAMIMLIVAAFVAAPMSVLASEGGDGGGEVTNVLPTVESFANDEGSTARTGVTDIFEGVVKDDNGEQDVDTIRVALSGAASATFTTDVSQVDWDTEISEPAEFSDGWKVWSNGGERNGEIAFKFQYTYATTGSHDFVADAEDGVGFGATSSTISVSVTDPFSVHAHPVNADGTDDTGALWGGWAAEPGATNVESANYLKVTNTGDFDEQAFVVNFNSATFVGATDVSFEIDLETNIKFACAETTSGQNPADLTFTMGDTSASGSVECTFSAGSALGDGVMYVQYEIVSIDAPMAVQSYEASYTVSE